MRQSVIVVLLIVAMLLLAVANLLWGSLSIPVADVVRILLGGQVGSIRNGQISFWRVVFPRCLQLCFVVCRSVHAV